DSYISSKSWPVPIQTAIQNQPLGTANAYQAASKLITTNQRLLCINGDDLYSPQDITRLVENEFGVLGQEVPDPEKWGILKPDVHGMLEKIVEKPSEYIGNIANTGA